MDWYYHNLHGVENFFEKVSKDDNNTMKILVDISILVPK